MSRRLGVFSGAHTLWISAAVLALGMVAWHEPGEGAPAAPVISPARSVAHPVSGVLRIGTTVSDLDASVEFYTRALGFEVVSVEERSGPSFERLTGVFASFARVARMRLGHEEIELTEFLAPQGRPVPVDSRSNDRWFQHIAIVVSDMDRAYAHLRLHKVRHASSGPQTLPKTIPNAAGISAFYFKDPDGHTLEVIHFPPEKGDPRWQRTGGKLFLGIDHTAIVVADTDQSLRFYRDALGLTVAGESENFGVEQEHLNNVFGARLRITGLRAASGPGVELLEYLAPSDGRPAPLDTRATDLWHWQTTLAIAEPGAVLDAARGAGGELVSPSIVGGAVMLRDADGHAIVLQQPDQTQGDSR
jgi:catechol 2,3-dioxygenase-like lactoylglutathione lyase family enzyme